MQPRYWDDNQWNGANYPVVGITWYEAMAYCRWLSAQTGDTYRLPSEAEWEKAARGPIARIYPWGNRWEPGRCNSKEEREKRTSPVGSYPTGASPYGALDIAGNVWEWTRSEYRDYPYDPQGDQEDMREDMQDLAKKRFILRGGSWWNEKTYVRRAARLGNLPVSYGADLGFRVLLAPRP